MRQETARLNKTRETIQRKLRTVEDSKSDLEFQRETLKGQILGLERGKLDTITNIKIYFTKIKRFLQTTLKSFE